MERRGGKCIFQGDNGECNYQGPNKYTQKPSKARLVLGTSRLNFDKLICVPASSGNTPLHVVYKSQHECSHHE